MDSLISETDLWTYTHNFPYNFRRFLTDIQNPWVSVPQTQLTNVLLLLCTQCGCQVCVLLYRYVCGEVAHCTQGTSSSEGEPDKQPVTWAWVRGPTKTYMSVVAQEGERQQLPRGDKDLQMRVKYIFGLQKPWRTQEFRISSSEQGKTTFLRLSPTSLHFTELFLGVSLFIFNLRICSSFPEKFPQVSG